MPVKVRLNDGINLIVRAEISAFRKAYEDALKHKTVLEVENGAGKMRIINPVQILYFEDASQSDAESDPHELQAARSPDDDPLPVA